MATVNTFLCNCGKNIGRPYDKPFEGGTWGVVPWHAELGQAKLHGVKCSGCRINWLFVPSAGGPWADIVQCCKDHRCGCRYQVE